MEITRYILQISSPQVFPFRIFYAEKIVAANFVSGASSDEMMIRKHIKIFNHYSLYQLRIPHE